ncbi:hypothetical protein PCASD_25453 [Puccinia coronata f. sp. avenae]|uniref:Uncharacterized protein n=1 Tax=Puccinia coronata f. sp. avenae TaxID=200324 RepID=A0A2N5SAM7_9BASI|nr:hypothetical protein PCASD_25453 [Puccinia coronata f. sp. avenae]
MAIIEPTGPTETGGLSSAVDYGEWLDLFLRGPSSSSSKNYSLMDNNPEKC